MPEKVKCKFPSYDGYYDCGLPDTDGISRSGKFVYFGKYPQNEITSQVESLEKNLPAEAAALLKTELAYEKHEATAAPYNCDVLLENDRQILNGEKYAFSCDRIKWYVLDEDDEYATLACCNVIAASKFDGQSCTYRTSELRQWLNGKFYDEAFDEICKQSIVPQNGDNVSLLAADDLNTDKGRWFLCCRFPSPTEYARVTGVNCERIRDGLRFDGKYASWWWLKDGNGKLARCYDFINDDGAYKKYEDLAQEIINNTTYKSPTDIHGGVVPVIKIKLNSEKNSRNKFQESADVIKKDFGNGINEVVEYKCPCGQGKICSEAAWGFNDYAVWLECDSCAEKYNLYTGRGHLWELKEIIKETKK